MTNRTAMIVAAGAIGLSTAALLGVADGGSAPATSAGSIDMELPAAPAPAFLIPEPRPLSDSSALARWATVERPVVARQQPSSGAAAVTTLSTGTPEGTANLVLVLGRARSGPGGLLWVRVRLPILPNNITGWVPRGALGAYHLVSTRLIIDLERLTATLYRRGEPVFHAPIGVGQPQWPTPKGQFYIRAKLSGYGGAGSFYGPLAFLTSATSPTLTDWPGGGMVGVHGTSLPGLIPGKISHGCVRMKNADILKLAKLMPVGTPITIR